MFRRASTLLSNHRYLYNRATQHVVARRNTSSTTASRAIVSLVSEMYQLPKEKLWKGYYIPDQVAIHIRTHDDLLTMLNCVKDENWKKQLVRRIPKTKLSAFLAELPNEKEKNQIKELMDDHTFLGVPVKISEPHLAEKKINVLNPREKAFAEALNAVLDAQIEKMDNENLNEAYIKMDKWFEKYINNPEFYNISYTDKHSKELVAEATFWCVNLGLDKHFEKMSYSELRQFRPLDERRLIKTERSPLLIKICDNLKKPDWSYEASYALGQAALCIYGRKHTFEKLEEDEIQYEENEKIRNDVNNRLGIGLLATFVTEFYKLCSLRRKVRSHNIGEKTGFRY